MKFYHHTESSKQVKIYNAVADFLLEILNPPIPVMVGEVESSPVVQMITASLGHLATPLIKYILG